MAKLQQYKLVHDPDSILDYGRNWGDALDGTKGWLHEDELIVTSDWFITADKEAIPTLIQSAQGTGISDDKKITAIFVQGGTPGVVYKLTNEITTLEDATSIRTERKTGLLFCCTK